MKTIGGIQVVKKIRKYILDNNLKQGSRLPTHDSLCKELDVGFRPLREGLSILSQQGIIETRRKAGTFVKKPSVKSLMENVSWHLEGDSYTFQDIVRARAAVESAISAEAARSRTKRDLQDILDPIEMSEAESSPTQIEEDADEIFHLSILAASHNPVLLIFGKLIREQFKRKLDSVRHPSHGRFLESQKEHREIYKHIKESNLEAARDAMHDHIMSQLGGPH